MYIIDTKWKTPKSGQPSDKDLRKIFTYLLHFIAERDVLLYPRVKEERIIGSYVVNGANCEMVYAAVVEEGRLNHSAL